MQEALESKIVFSERKASWVCCLCCVLLWSIIHVELVVFYQIDMWREVWPKESLFDIFGKYVESLGMNRAYVPFNLQEQAFVQACAIVAAFMLSSQK
jgi:hypothetical protein